MADVAPAFLAMSINRYLYISLYCHHRVSSGAAEPGAAWTKLGKGKDGPCPGPTVSDILISSLKNQQDVFLLHKNSCQRVFHLDPLKGGE